MVTSGSFGHANESPDEALRDFEDLCETLCTNSVKAHEAIQRISESVDPTDTETGQLLAVLESIRVTQGSIILAMHAGFHALMARLDGTPTRSNPAPRHTQPVPPQPTS